MRYLLLSAACLIAAPAAAQDYTGNVNPSAWSGPQVMHSAIRAQNKGARASTSSDSAAATCRQLPTLRRKHGADDPRLVELSELCRRAGYRR